MENKSYYIYLMGVPNQVQRKIGMTTRLDLRLEEIRKETKRQMQILDFFSVDGTTTPEGIWLPPDRVALDIEDDIKLLGRKLGCSSEFAGGKKTEYFTHEIDWIFEGIKKVYCSNKTIGHQLVRELTGETIPDLEERHTDILKRRGAQYLRLRHILRQVHLATPIVLDRLGLSTDDLHDIEYRAKKFFPK